MQAEKNGALAPVKHDLIVWIRKTQHGLQDECALCLGSQRILSHVALIPSPCFRRFRSIILLPLLGSFRLLVFFGWEQPKDTRHEHLDALLILGG